MDEGFAQVFVELHEDEVGEEDLGDGDFEAGY